MFESYFELYERHVRINLRSLAAHTLSFLFFFSKDF